MCNGKLLTRWWGVEEILRSSALVGGAEVTPKQLDYLVPLRRKMKTESLGEKESTNVGSVGSRSALIDHCPVTAGFQIQVAEVVAGLLIHPGILSLFQKKVTTPA
jgi:hypothetical protein